MARLAIYNGNALVREVDVSEGTLRVGRSDQNDIVLIDPGKAVSRFHAELRIEHGTCAVTDLNSQNGTWVAGRRVQQATLAPGQAVVVGTHRLLFKADVPQREVVDTVAGQLAESRPALPPVALASPEPAPPAPAIAAGAPVEARATMPAPVLVHRPHGPKAAPPPPPIAAKPVGRPGRGLLLLAGVICLAAAGVAGGMFWRPASSRTPEVPRVAVETATPQAVPGGPPTETPVGSVLAPPGGAPTPATPASAGMSAAPAAATPAAASALTPPAAIPAPPPAPVAASPVPVKTKRGGQGPVAAPPRNAAEPRTREIDRAQLIEQARAAINRRDYAAGLRFLEPVMRVDAGNPQALDLLAAVRAQGHEAFKRGRQLDALGRTPEAIAMYERATRLLPPDHPSAQIARERLVALR